MSKYLPTIGIETHVQLKTKTKLFAAVGNDAREAAPNSLISHICVGLPGALPVLNKAAVELAMRTAFVLNTKPQKFSKFDRKHYFYPDLPKGYQISQFDQPIIIGGHVDIEVDGKKRKIGITRAHLEEDAGKNTHPTGVDYSLVDLNRAGTPLLEIISEPDIHGPEEAKAYVRELYLLMKYADVSDCDLYHGNMRFDVNISVSKNRAQLGTRSEIKNLNSFRSVEGAVAYEIKRQTELLEKGDVVVQETRGWDEAKQKTLSQRNKEEAHDYRYMPEPDIPPIELTDTQIEKAAKTVPTLPAEIRAKLMELSIDTSVVEDILNVPQTTHLVLRLLEQSGADHARRIAFWLLQAAEEPADVIDDIGSNTQPIDDFKFITLSQMVADNKLSSTAAKEVLKEMLKTSNDPQEIAQSLNLLQVSDEAEIEKIVKEVLKESPKVVSDVEAGEHKAIGFLVGQVMKKSAGKANPGLAQKIIKKQLEI